MLFAASPIRKAAYRTLRHVKTLSAGATGASRRTQFPGDTNTVPPIDTLSTAHANTANGRFWPPSATPPIRKAVLRNSQHVKPSTAGAKGAIKTTPQDTLEQATKPLLNYTYEAHPQPLNCTTYASTRLIALERDHPLHIRTQRRLAEFDPKILHWAVHVPVEVNKKAIVRSWVKRRVREAFGAELKGRGWDLEGRVVQGGEAKEALKGALCVRIGKESAAEVLKASGEEVQRQCGLVLGRLVGQMKRKGRVNVDKAGEPRRVWDEQWTDHRDSREHSTKAVRDEISKHPRTDRGVRRARSDGFLNPGVDRSQRDGDQMWW